jgi:hypothetical protein
VIYVPHDLVLTITQPQCLEIDVLQELGNSHEIYQTIALFPADRLIPESLREQQIRHQPRGVGFDYREYDHGEEDVSRYRCGLRWGRWRRYAWRRIGVPIRRDGELRMWRRKGATYGPLRK